MDVDATMNNVIAMHLRAKFDWCWEMNAITLLYSENSPLYLKDSSKAFFDYKLFLRSIAGEPIQWILVCLKHRLEGIEEVETI